MSVLVEVVVPVFPLSEVVVEVLAGVLVGVSVGLSVARLQASSDHIPPPPLIASLQLFASGT